MVDRVVRVVVQLDGAEYVTTLADPQAETVDALVRRALCEANKPSEILIIMVLHTGVNLPLQATLAHAIADLPRYEVIVLQVFAHRLTAGEVHDSSWEIKLFPNPDRVRSEAAGTDSDSEFELTLDDSHVPPAEEDSAVEEEALFDMAFEVPASEEESASQVVAQEDSDADLESSGVNLASREKEPLDEEMDFDEEEAPRSRAGTLPTPAFKRRKATAPVLADRHATVRYYSRMNPQRFYPFLVAFSKEELLRIEQKHVAQESRKVRVRLDQSVLVEPILPGCDCYPRRKKVTLTDDTVSVTFLVVPNVLGTIPEARVRLRQGKTLLGEIPLDIRVVNRTLVTVMGAATFVVPFGSAILRHFHLDFESQLQEGFAPYAVLLRWLVEAVRPEGLAALFLIATVFAYFSLRPRRRDAFWDLETAGQQPRTWLGWLGEKGWAAAAAGLWLGTLGLLAALGVGGAIFGLAAWANSLQHAGATAPFTLVGLPLLGGLGGFLIGAVVGALEGANG